MASAEAPVRGIIYRYAATLINYALALAYVVALTRYIPADQYGQYNALIAIAGLIAMAFPTLGIDVAIAREGAALHGKGRDAAENYSALFAISLIVSSTYAAAVVAATPLYLANGIPPSVIPAAYIYAAYIVLSGLATALEYALWMRGRYAAQNKGWVAGNLAFRTAEIALIVAARNVLAIPAAMALGHGLRLAYYYLAVGPPPGIKPGLRKLRRGLRKYLNLGLQEWTLSYVGTAAASATTYIIFHTLGAVAASLYGIAVYITGIVGALPGAVANIFTSRAAAALGAGSDAQHILRDYAKAASTAAGLLATAAAAAAPLLPYILHGQYAQATPYAAALFGSAALAAANGIYTQYYWLTGRGWKAVAIGAAGSAISVATTAALASLGLGLYSAVAAAYIGASIAMAIYVKKGHAPAWRYAAIYTALPAATALAYIAAPAYWPIPQIAATALAIGATYALKPIPASAAAQLPKPARIALTPFTS
jgi:O-antigen/teichoic acid export membrane protein